jgi:hypothetical protein
MALAETVEALRREPLWATSSAARELFHSDMLQWLVQNEPAAFAGLFDLDTAGSYRCHRERGHLDLWVEAVSGGRGIVIENKLFSLPKDEQLDAYAKKIADRPAMAGCKQLLLSLTKPSWPDGRYGEWSWMSYETLGRRLNAAFSGRDDFAGMFAAHWGGLCRLLHELAEAVAVAGDDERYELEVSKRDHLDARLFAFAQLLRAYQLADRIRRSLDDPSIAVAVGLTRAKASVEAFTRYDEHFELGWQFQEGQWRLAVRAGQGAEYEGRPCHGRTQGSRDSRAAWAQASVPGHFCFDELDGAGIASSRAKTRNSFQHFDPDFTYRYRKVSSPTVAQLVAAGTAAGSRFKAECHPSAT